MCNTLMSTILLLLMCFVKCFNLLTYSVTRIFQNQNIRITHGLILLIGNSQIKLFDGLLNL